MCSLCPDRNSSRLLLGCARRGVGRVERTRGSPDRRTTPPRACQLGGGTGQARSGELSRAHHGALRQPLQSGEITIARGEESVTLPARAMVVLACKTGLFVDRIRRRGQLARARRSRSLTSTGPHRPPPQSRGQSQRLGGSVRERES
ncbi:MAG TPA: ATP-binding protein, partial [Nocardioidaceae bacterium]|nr:ATP-binding protein [Nocardioidaceae bacterium]